MSFESSIQLRRLVLINAALITIVTAVEVLLYPAIATDIYSLAGGNGGPGSSIGYFRDTYVLVGAGTFLALTVLGLWAGARNDRTLRWTLVVAWITNVGLLAGSSLWYFHTIRAASEYRG